MKTVLPAVMIALAVFAFNFSAPPAAATATKPETPAARGLVGQYKGSWKSADDTTGDLRFGFSQNGEGHWVAEATFTFEGTTVPTRMKTVRVEGTKIELLFEWDADGNVAHSKVTGELKGDKLEGNYVTGGGAGETRGTWTVTRV
jgi:hypothetical protein